MNKKKLLVVIAILVFASVLSRLLEREAGSGVLAREGCSCTEYALERRPDLVGVCVGDAFSWAIQARDRGLPTGRIPRVGAIAVFQPGEQGADSESGHVAYVEEVRGRTEFRVSEKGWVDPSIGCNDPCEVCSVRWAHTSGSVEFIYKTSGTHLLMQMLLQNLRHTSFNADAAN